MSRPKLIPVCLLIQLMYPAEILINILKLYDFGLFIEEIRKKTFLISPFSASNDLTYIRIDSRIRCNCTWLHAPTHNTDLNSINQQWTSL